MIGRFFRLLLRDARRMATQWRDGVWVNLNIAVTTGVLFYVAFFITTANCENKPKRDEFKKACTYQALPSVLPRLGFSCLDKRIGGFYADMQTGCQIFHVCVPNYEGGLTDYPFCCHPDLVFDQKFLTCDRPEAVDCDASEQFYNDQFNTQTDPRSGKTVSDQDYPGDEGILHSKPKDKVEVNVEDLRVFTALDVTVAPTSVVKETIITSTVVSRTTSSEGDDHNNKDRKK